MLRKLFIPVLLACFVTSSYGEGHYTIIAPQNIRAHSDYHVSASLHDANEPSTIRLTVKNDRGFRDSKEVTVQPYTTKMVSFSTGDLQHGDYSIVAEGVSGIIFTNESSITLHEKAQTVLIQTDKAMYKPGDKVNFRILVLDLNLKPNAIRGDMRVFMSDSSNNRIKQWLNATTTKGVFIGELQLSDFPNLGDWNINVEVNGETKKKSFEIAEYVLPKYEVTIDTDKDITFKDGQIRVTVRAKYTYGKPVKGQAVVTVGPKVYGGYQPLVSDLLSRRTITVDGKGYVEFDIKNDLKANDAYQRDFIIEASVTEDLTGSTQSGKASVAIHKYKYTITAVDSQSSYKPGLPSVITVKIAYHDGAPVVDTINKVNIIRSYEWDASKGTSEEYTLDSNGMIYVKYSIPANNSGVYFHAKYLEQEVNLGYYTKSESKTGQYIQARVQTPNPRIDREVSVEVTSTEPLEYFTYQILGRGDIIVTRTEPVPKTTHFVFNFLASFAMVPKAQLIVYYMKDGEIISDQIEIEFGEELHNFVKVDTSATQAKPGQNIDITVSTKAGSFVGLLGVDQSVILLKDGNDLSKSEVLSELDEYNRGRYSQWTDYNGWQDFKNVVLLTNAIEPERREVIEYYDYDDASNFMDTTRINDNSKKDSVKKGDVRSPTVRVEFPETWIFELINDSHWTVVNSNLSTGTKTIQKKVPDTITSWVITGFTMNDVYGLGLTKSPSTLKVFQPFFVSLNLPYSIKRGEAVAIQIVVFNYMDKSVSATVTLENAEQEFVFSDPSNEVEEKPKIEKSRKKNINIKSNDGAPVSFLITPTKAGPIKIKVTATSSLAGDAIEKTLLVVPEGVPQHKTKAFFIDLRDKSEFSDKFTMEIPKNAVPDSTRITVSGVGDIMSSSIKNLDKLIQMPNGCGEQNMLNFVPCIVAINYLKNTGQLTKSIESKALNFMEIGYQRELTYKHDDGSFSAFGKTDSSGSTWLTAFVVRSFLQARNHIMVQDKIITEALNWLNDNQAPDGSFPEVGRVIHKDMQGGSSKGVALTAFVVTAFLEDPTKIATYRDTITRALEYIIRNLEGVDDAYSLAVASYATQLAKDQSRTVLFQKLDASAKTNGDLKHWEKSTPQEEAKNPWLSQPNSINVEMTAYALLTLVNNNQITEGLPIMKWLLSQQNENGGFQSTQDTVVGITALAKYAEKIAFGDSNAVLGVSYKNGSESAIRINKENSLLLQTLEIPPEVRSINVKATGSGFALCQLSYKYNLNVTGAWPRFVLDPQVNKNSNADYLHLTVCTSFVPSGDETESNMAVMEVSYPSGVIADPERIPSLESSKGVKKVETKNGDTTIVVYIDNLGTEELCFAIDGYRTNKVANQKPSPVIIYDYYDTSKKATMFYQSSKNHLCEICDDAACKDACIAKTAAFTSGNDGKSTVVLQKSAANKIAVATFVLILVAVQSLL
ncbi:CD109 antigen-like isoform X2 [Bradysia coprophila]|uniref:CD109 antigen-like isoform X2 n=1 Tax=Bradysia coprophila TaxID=38358 RepID=UPI00187DC99A|nr:CD109 antigen-like isoform X2 [Bradysia coprophila]